MPLPRPLSLAWLAIDLISPNSEITRSWFCFSTGSVFQPFPLLRPLSAERRGVPACVGAQPNLSPRNTSRRVDLVREEPQPAGTPLRSASPLTHRARGHPTRSEITRSHRGTKIGRRGPASIDLWRPRRTLRLLRKRRTFSSPTRPAGPRAAAAVHPTGEASGERDTSSPLRKSFRLDGRRPRRVSWPVGSETLFPTFCASKTEGPTRPPRRDREKTPSVRSLCLCGSV